MRYQLRYIRIAPQCFMLCGACTNIIVLPVSFQIPSPAPLLRDTHHAFLRTVNCRVVIYPTSKPPLDIRVYPTFHACHPAN